MCTTTAIHLSSAELCRIRMIVFYAMIYTFLSIHFHMFFFHPFPIATHEWMDWRLMYSTVCFSWSYRKNIDDDSLMKNAVPYFSDNTLLMLLSHLGTYLHRHWLQRLLSDRREQWTNTSGFIIQLSMALDYSMAVIFRQLSIFRRRMSFVKGHHIAHIWMPDTHWTKRIRMNIWFEKRW